MGKLNVPKMANFLEIDIYVLVACPENSLVDSHEFYKPVVTPFEMELACIRYVHTMYMCTQCDFIVNGCDLHVHVHVPACVCNVVSIFTNLMSTNFNLWYAYRSCEWSGDFITSFQELLPSGPFHVPNTDDKSDKVCRENVYNVKFNDI